MVSLFKKKKANKIHQRENNVSEKKNEKKLMIKTFKKGTSFSFSFLYFLLKAILSFKGTAS